MKKTNKIKKAQKPSATIKCYVDKDTHKKFMKKTESQGMHASQWIRHQIMKWVK